jgi:hypothetical protein
MYLNPEAQNESKCLINLQGQISKQPLNPLQVLYQNSDLG